MIRLESPRWRPKETQVRVHLGVQEQPVQKSTPRPHTESVLDALYMDGKIISRSFQWKLFEAQIHSELTGIVEKIERTESVRLPQHNLLGRSPVYRLGAHRGVSRGGIHDLNLIYSVAAGTLGLEVLFRSDFPSRNCLLHCNCDDKSFCCESGPSFLFFTTAAFSPFVIRA